MRNKGEVCERSPCYKVDVRTVILQCLLNQFPGSVGMFIQSVRVILVIVNGFQGP